MPAVPFSHLRLSAEKPPPATYPCKSDTPGKRLRRRRLELGLTQRELGRALGVHPDTTRNWELDRTRPGVKHTSMLANFPAGFTLPEPDSGAVFPVRLRRARERLGLTQKELAAELGVAESTVWHWEKGHHRPLHRCRERLQKLLGGYE